MGELEISLNVEGADPDKVKNILIKIQEFIAANEGTTLRTFNYRE